MPSLPPELQPPELLAHHTKYEISYLRRAATYFDGQGNPEYAQQLRKQADDLEARQKKDDKVTPKEFAAALKGQRLPSAAVEGLAAAVKGGRPLPGVGAKPSGVSEEAIRRVRAADGKWLRERLNRPVPVRTPSELLSEQVARVVEGLRRQEKRKSAGDKYDRAMEGIRRHIRADRAVNFLVECVCDAKMSVGDDEPVLKGVRILGADSLNRRKYTEQAMRAALPMYEGVRVYLNHPRVPTDNRDVADLFGFLENVRLEGGGIVGDLRYDPAHPKAASVTWWAAHSPNLVGLSHNAVGTGKTQDGVFVVEKIHSVRSVDLVCEPATTGGLF
jgi:hypothetical protein